MGFWKKIRNPGEGQESSVKGTDDVEEENPFGVCPIELSSINEVRFDF